MYVYQNCGYWSVFVEVIWKYNRGPSFLNHSVYAEAGFCKQLPKDDCIQTDTYILGTSIPPQCCAVPYTLNGALYYNCTVNSNVSNNVGCYDNNGQWLTCLQPHGYFFLSLFPRSFSFPMLGIPPYGNSHSRNVATPRARGMGVKRTFAMLIS